MGAVVPFPIRRTQGETRSARMPPETPGEVVILPVVQFVRTGTSQYVSASTSSSREPL